MEFIINSRKYGKHTVMIDDEDAEKVLQYKWWVHCSNRYGHPRITSVRTNQKGNNLYLHRLIFPNVKMVDHIDGNVLNNTKANLRECTKFENAQNKKQKTKNKCFKGVRKSNNFYSASITAYNRIYFLGFFETKDQAAIAYNIAALKHHGKFARLNNIMRDNRYEQSI